MAGCTCLSAQAILPGSQADWSNLGLDNSTIDYLKSKDFEYQYKFKDSTNGVGISYFTVIDKDGNKTILYDATYYKQDYDYFKSQGEPFRLNFHDNGEYELPVWGNETLEDLLADGYKVFDVESKATIEKDYQDYINSLDVSKFDESIAYVGSKEITKPINIDSDTTVDNISVLANGDYSKTFLDSNGNVITNEGQIGSIKGDFIGVSTVNYESLDTLIMNSGSIKEISANFIGNNMNSDTVYHYNTYYGVAIFNEGNIDKIKNSKFINNKVNTGLKNYDIWHLRYPGTVIMNNGRIGSIENSIFLNNINTINDVSIAVLTNKDMNFVADNGLTEFTGNDIAVYATSEDFYLYNDRNVDLNGNTRLEPPVITLRAENNGKIVMNDKISGDVNVRPYTRENYVKDPSLDNKSVTLYKDKADKVLFKIYSGKNSNNEYVTFYLDENNNELGQDWSEWKDNQDIYHILDKDGNEIGTSDKGYSDQLLQEKVKPENYKLNIDGDSTGIVYLNNNVEAVSSDDSLHAAADISLSNTQLRLGVRDNVLDGNNLTLNSGTFNMVNNQVGISALNRMTVVGDTNFVADVDLANKEMDRFTANSYGKHTGNLNVSGMNLLSDATDPKTEIYFAQEGLKDNVTTTVTEVAYTPIYKYNVRYENRDDAGYFVFDRTAGSNGGGSNGGSNGGTPSDAFNPAVLSSPVSSVAAAQATINETFKYVFEHADAFTQMPSHVRFAKMNENKYALSTDFNNNIPMTDLHNKAAWFRPYATFETMNLKNGPKVDAITYGSLAGFDTDFHEHKHGWHSVGTGYIGYNGSQLSYKGVDTTMNGGILGYTHTMYKGNFWTALTLSAGASVGESRTMYGKEDFTSLMAGVGSKTGYNFEFKEGKYILQPIMFMSYTFVNTFDYTNAAGVRINADPAHSIQLNPSIRFISNFRNGWQPYASVGMVWNVMNENNVTANNVRLPEMSMKPYVEYGIGVQRNWKDKFTAFGQAMLRNGGRNGIALTAGFRWALGKDTPQHNDKVEAPKTDRTVLKQLSPQQKMALSGKKNTTITSAKAVLKQL